MKKPTPIQEAIWTSQLVFPRAIRGFKKMGFAAADAAISVRRFGDAYRKRAS